MPTTDVDPYWSYAGRPFAYVPSADEDAEADPYWLDLGIFVVGSALGICLTYRPQIPRG